MAAGSHSVSPPFFSPASLPVPGGDAARLTVWSRAGEGERKKAKQGGREGRGDQGRVNTRGNCLPALLLPPHHG